MTISRSGYQRIDNLILALAVLFGLAATTTAELKDRPNIVLILADDMGYGDVQHLNPNSTIPTPNIDRIAIEGMTFTDGHSPSAVCTPTRYGLLTGRYCWRTSLKKGVLGGYSPPLLEPGRPTIASLLKAGGYRTAAVGKWHLGMALPLHADAADVSKWDGDPGIDFSGVIVDSPIHHGFDEYFGVSASLDMAPYVYIRNDRFTALPSEQQRATPFPHFIRKGPRAADFVVDQVLDRLTEEAINAIRRGAADERPFFLYLPLTAPHKPTQPHARFLGRSKLGEYGDFVIQVDDAVGRVLAALDEADVAGETIVIYTSDNGSYMTRLDEAAASDHVDQNSIQGYRPSHHRPNGSLRGTKADIWEAGHRVPLFVRWPEVVAAGSRCTQTVCLTDWYATVADMMGKALQPTEGEDSCSLLPMLRQQPNAARPAPVVHHSVGGMFAIRDANWKLVAGNGSGGREQPAGKPDMQPYQLYDLTRDLGELSNVAEQRPDVVQRMSQRLNDIRAGQRSRPAHATPNAAE